MYVKIFLKKVAVYFGQVNCIVFIEFKWTETKESFQETQRAWKITSSVLLKLFISGYEICHTTEAS